MGEDAKVMSFCYELYKAQQLTDLSIVCKDDQQVKVHSVIMAAYSEYIKQFLQGVGNIPYCEKVIFCKDDSVELIKLIVEYLYSGDFVQLASLNNLDLEKIKTIAQRLKVPLVYTKVEEVIKVRKSPPKPLSILPKLLNGNTCTTSNNEIHFIVVDTRTNMETIQKDLTTLQGLSNVGVPNELTINLDEQSGNEKDSVEVKQEPEDWSVTCGLCSELLQTEEAMQNHLCTGTPVSQSAPEAPSATISAASQSAKLAASLANQPETPVSTSALIKTQKSCRTAVISGPSITQDCCTDPVKSPTKEQNMMFNIKARESRKRPAPSKQSSEKNKDTGKLTHSQYVKRQATPSVATGTGVFDKYPEGALDSISCVMPADRQKVYDALSVDCYKKPSILQQKVLFDLLTHFGEMSQDEIVNLKKGDFVIYKDDNSLGKRFVRRCNGDESNIRMYESTRLQDLMCPVRTFAYYSSKLNKQCDLLFQLPTEGYCDDQSLWYRAKPQVREKLGCLCQSPHCELRTPPNQPKNKSVFSTFDATALRKHMAALTQDSGNSQRLYSKRLEDLNVKDFGSPDKRDEKTVAEAISKSNKRGQMNYQKWSEEEEKEIKTIFSQHFAAKRRPTPKEISKGQAQSVSNGGHIQYRGKDILGSKIFRMIDKLRKPHLSANMNEEYLFYKKKKCN